MQERRVRFLASGARLYFGLLLAAIRAAHAMKMWVELFAAVFALRRAPVQRLALWACLAVFPSLPFVAAVVALQQPARSCHHGVKRTVALDVAAEVRHKTVSGIRRYAGAAA